MIEKLNKSEIRIIKTLGDYSNAKKISKIAEETNLSYFSIRNIVKSLYLSGICEKGNKDGNAETYYLTKQWLEKRRTL